MLRPRANVCTAHDKRLIKTNPVVERLSGGRPRRRQIKLEYSYKFKQEPAETDNDRSHRVNWCSGSKGRPVPTETTMHHGVLAQEKR